MKNFIATLGLLILQFGLYGQTPKSLSELIDHPTPAILSKNVETVRSEFAVFNDCRQIQFSNNFEDGLFINDNNKIADDILLSENVTNLAVTQLIVRFINNFGAATVDIYFYEDANSLPGQLVGSPFTNVVPSSQTVIGSAFGLNVYETIIDLPEPFDLAGNGTTEVTYWYRIAAAQQTGDEFVALEVTSVDLNGSTLVADNDLDDTDDWQVPQTGLDVVGEVVGDCTFIDICLPVTNVIITDKQSESVAFTWDINEVSENGYIVEVFEDGADPETATAVFTGTAASGVNEIVVTGLDPITFYDLYITSDCGAQGLSGAVQFEFSSAVAPPVCGGTFLDSGGADGQFGNNEDLTYVITPDVAGDLVTVIFTEVAVEPPFDILSVDVGNGVFEEVPNVNVEEGDIPLRYISTETDGSLTFRFTSNDIVPLDGWEATVTCAPPASCTAPVFILDNGGEATSNDFEWDASDTASEGYIVTIYPEGGDPTVDAPLVTQTFPENVTSGTINGLEGNTAYTACVRANCGDDGDSLFTCVNFITSPGSLTCGDEFFDTGGIDGEYQNNESYEVLIENSSETDVIALQFTSVDIEFSFDILRIYDGDTTDAPEFPTGNFGLEEPSFFISSIPGGNILVTFDSDVSAPATGWEAVISCVEAGACAPPSNLTHSITGDRTAQMTWVASGEALEGYTIEVFEQGSNPFTATPLYTDTTIATGSTETTISGLDANTIFDVYLYANCEGGGSSTPVFYSFLTAPASPECDDVFTDSNVIEFGGGFFGYDNDERFEYVITPSGENEIITVDFSFVEIEEGFDFLRIYDGEDDSAPELTDGNGVQSPGSFSTTVPGGSIYITFTSDDFVSLEGWDATVSCATLSAETFDSLDISLWPNPMATSLNIAAPEKIEKVTIYSLTGQRVQSTRLETDTTTVDVGSLSSGIYFVEVTMEQSTYVHKVIKD